jgi:hypothetical protein
MHDLVGRRSVRMDLALIARRGYESRLVAPAPSYNADVPRSVGAVDTAMSDIEGGKEYICLQKKNAQRSPCAVLIRLLVT